MPWYIFHEQTMVKISVIIPVYNSESYLCECLDSLVNQTISDIEIICIDNESKDNSLQILNDYAKKDNRIKVLSHKNQGPSAARNYGIEHAIGEYITFVDSDDWVTLGMCEKVYNKISAQNADILLYSLYRYANTQAGKDERTTKAKNAIMQDRFDFEQASKELILSVPMTTVGKVYRTKFIKDNNLKFDEKISIGEDRLFYLSLCLKNPAFCILDEYFYYYRINTVSSLSKDEKMMDQLFQVYNILLEELNNSKYKNDSQIKFYMLENALECLSGFANSCYCAHLKNRSKKYLNYFCNKYKELPPEFQKESKFYKISKKIVNDISFNFWKKLFQPLIEVERRPMRFVLYLFEKQIINIPGNLWDIYTQTLIYSFILIKLRIISKFRKIRVGFFVTDSAKWTCGYLYNELKKDKHFEPFILLSYFKTQQGNLSPKDYYLKTKKYFENQGIVVYDTFDCNNNTFSRLDKFKPDIVFYQQPWLIHSNQRPELYKNNPLLCYVPYCFYSMDSILNYLSKFHAGMWKYFVETELHKQEYEQKYNAINCVVSGSAKLDGYHYVKKEQAEKCWKTKNKKRIIYAPHHSFNDGMHEVATFNENGKFILELAKNHSETEWIFRPHPMFNDRVLKNSIMTNDELEKYYKEWASIGTISEDGNYYELFSSSDLLITDCISFLAEYAPTLKPVFHLRKSNQKEEFNSLVKRIDKTYYQIYTNEELEKIFEQVVINNDDYLSTQREANVTILSSMDLASNNIYNYIKKELLIL